MPPKTVISIQSHVAYGHVGNAAAVFPLQRLGFEVWPAMTVQLSNHPGYGDFGGGPLAETELRGVLDGMSRRGAFAACSGLLTGYLGGPGLAAAVLDGAARVKQAHPGARYLCDPVMGDADGGLYVDPAIPELFRSRAVELADVLTPNLFELETLTGRKLGGQEEILGAARSLLARGPRLVLVTSVEETGPTGEIAMLLVAHDSAWRLASSRIAFSTQPHGAGDLVAALLLGQLLLGRDDAEAFARTAAALQEVLRITAETGGGELALVAAQEAFAGDGRLPEVERIA